MEIGGLQTERDQGSLGTKRDHLQHCLGLTNIIQICLREMTDQSIVLYSGFVFC